MSRSLMYKNIGLYRAAMQFLYTGKYFYRFETVKKIISEKKAGSVIELCFGDIQIAEYCRNNHISWQGYDMNPSFVELASKNGYSAELSVIDKDFSVPQGDLCVLMGAFFHFHPNNEKLLENILDKCPILIINEPIKNDAPRNKLLMKLGAKLTDPGNGINEFRYSEESLTGLLNDCSHQLDFSYYTAEKNRKEMTVVLERNHV